MTGARTSTQYWNRSATPAGELIVLDDTGIVTSILPSGPVATTNTLRLPGIAGNYVSTPDSVPLSITSDIDLRAKVALDDITQRHTFIAKQQTTLQRSYDFEIGNGTPNRPWLGLSTDGSTVVSAICQANTPFVNGQVGWYRVTWRASDGRVQFFTSTDGTTWAQLGIDQTIAIASIFDSTSIVEIGSRIGGTNGLLTGYVYSAQVLNGINGTVVANFDATTVVSSGAESPSTFTGPLGNVWTINGSAWWWAAYSGSQLTTQKIQLDPQYVQFDGTSGNYASTPDSAALSITGDIDLRAKVALDNWTPPGSMALMGKYDSSTTKSYLLAMETTGKPSLYVSTDGSAASNFIASVATGLAAGATGWIRATRVQSTGVVTFYTSTDGVTWTQLGSTGVISAGSAIFDSTSAVEIGRQQTVWPIAGKVFYAEIRNGIGGSIVGAFDPYDIAVTAIRTPSSWTSFVVGSAVWTMNGSAWSYSPTISPAIQTPDSAALSITGDLDIRVKATLSDWGGLPRFAFLSKRTGTAGGYALRTTSSGGGTPELTWADGTSSFFITSSAVVPFTSGQTGWLRVTLDVDNGASGNTVAFYTSTDGVAWTQLGTSRITAGVTTVGDSADALYVGSVPGTTPGTQHLMGQVHYAEVRNGIGGTVVGVFNPAAVRFTGAQTPTTLGSPTGETWSVSGSGWSWVTS